jgi:hypothetical protein
MADNGGQIGVADFVERFTLGERVRLDLKIIEVRSPFGSRLGVVAALTILIVELAPQSLLVSQGNLIEGQGNFLSGFVSAGCGQLIAARG